MFHSFFNSLARSRYLSFFSHYYYYYYYYHYYYFRTHKRYTLVDPLHMDEQRQDDQLEPIYNSCVPISGYTSFRFLLFSINELVSKSQRILCVLFSKTDSGLCMLYVQILISWAIPTGSPFTPCLL